MKLTCVSKYRVRLRERDRRKRVARNHHLISTSIIPNKVVKTPNPKSKAAAAAATASKLAKEDKEWMERMKVFTQFQTAAEVEKLQEGLLSK